MVQGGDLSAVPELLLLRCFAQPMCQTPVRSCRLLPPGYRIAKQLHPYQQQLSPSPACILAQGPRTSQLPGNRTPAQYDGKSRRCLLLAQSEGKIFLSKFPRGDWAGWEAVMCAELGALGSRRMEKRTQDLGIPVHTPPPTQLRFSIPFPPALGFWELLGAG